MTTGTPTTATHSDNETPGLPERRRRPIPHRHIPWLGAGLLLLLLAALVLPPLININRYQHRIVASLSAGLGRPVEVVGMRLKLLPRPGVEIAHFAVEEAPAFGAEPMLQCSNVSASFRLLSLWRGQLEIARISLEDPSLNLERNGQGEWNFASVLTQASRTLQAPTARRIPGRQLRFPYIEATGARINFKQGDEKRPFSFLNADIAVWLEDPNEWRLRFAAQPVRTDISMSASDIGTVQVRGSVRRARALGEMPLDLDVAWSKAPLGQLSRLLTGEDSGWRADTDTQAHLGGTPDDLRVRAEVTAADFHRAEFQPVRSLGLHAICTGEYLRTSARWDHIECSAPVGDGRVALAGSATFGETGIVPFPVPLKENAPPAPSALTLTIDQVPAAGVLELLRHVRNSLSADATAAGTLDGRFSIAGSAQGWASAAVSGVLHTSDLTLKAPGAAEALVVPAATFVTDTVTNPAAPAPARSARTRTAHAAGERNARPANRTPSPELSLVLQPLLVDLGGARPLAVDGRLGLHTFAMHYAGVASLRRLLPIARGFGVFPSIFAGLAPEGSAEMNVGASGPWIAPVADVTRPALPSALYGTVRLIDASVLPAYLVQPLAIHSAQAAIGSAGINWSGIHATLGTLDFDASLRMPLPCPATNGCVRHFDVNAPQVNLAALRDALKGTGTGRELMRAIMERVETSTAAWPALEGSVRVDRLSAGKLLLHNATADVAINNDTVRILSLSARTLGGTVHGAGSMPLGGRKPSTAEVQLSRVNADDLASLFGEQWGGGVVDLSTRLRLSGSTAADLAKSAQGTFRLDWSNGGWGGATRSTGQPEAEPAAAGPAAAGRAAAPPSPFSHFDQWTAEGSVSAGALHLKRSILSSGGVANAVTGSVSFDRSVSLAVAGDGAAPPTAVSGTLGVPMITAASQ
ncbi:MAG: AsmA family protein [Acidobacteriaceae bacterium]